MADLDWERRGRLFQAFLNQGYPLLEAIAWTRAERALFEAGIAELQAYIEAHQWQGKREDVPLRFRRETARCLRFVDPFEVYPQWHQLHLMIMIVEESLGLDREAFAKYAFPLIYSLGGMGISDQETRLLLHRYLMKKS